MAKEISNFTEKIISRWFGGIVRDDKSKVIGGAFNMEELYIFANQDYFQAEQINSADSMPASTEIYAYATGDDDTVYGYGQKTTATVGTVRLVSVATGGADNPGTFGALFRSEIYAYATGDDDTVYGYGQKTTATVGTVRLVSVATGGADNPGTFGALFT